MKKFKKTKKRVLTRRGVIWLGQTCNLRCYFCYFKDRIATATHPEHPFMSLEKAKKICKTLVEYYKNTAVDIQGGEPTIYPQIYQLTSFCREIGLLPTLITNALVLDNIDTCKQLKDSGIRDCLVSVHGIDKTYDQIVGVKNAHKRQMKALENLNKLDIPIRFNCVLSKPVLPQLKDIAKLAEDVGSVVVNFIAFNPFEDQQIKGKRSSENVPRYSEVKPYLEDAMDFLEEAGIEYNVRYFPICIVEERFRKAMYNFQQLPYDIHEWDFASWSWTGMQSQRMKDGELSPVISLEEATIKPLSYPGFLNTLAISIRNRLLSHPEVLDIAKRLNRKISALFYKKKIKSSQQNNIEWLYRENARIRARDHCKYIYSPKCYNCDIQDICDGFHGDYASIFGVEEASPLEIGYRITDPKYFISNQEKIVEWEDYEWAL